MSHADRDGTLTVEKTLLALSTTPMTRATLAGGGTYDATVLAPKKVPAAVL